MSLGLVGWMGECLGGWVVVGVGLGVDLYINNLI